MQKGLLYIQAACIIAAILLASSLALAQIHDLTIVVQGMSCPFCAFGIEKKLKKVEGIESVTISMKDGTATVKAKKGLSIDIDRVQTAVKESGFTPGRITIIATGMIKMDEKKRPSLHLSGLAQTLPLIDLTDNIKGKVFSLAEAGKSLEIGGVARKQDGTWTLIPESLSEVTK